MRLSRSKRLLGRALFETCERLPFVKPWVARFGMRTSPEWFGNRIARVQLENGRAIRLGSIAENYLSFELFWKGSSYYEPVTSLLVRELAPANGTFIDVGANIGYYTLLLGSSRPEMRIIAFEPNPKNFHLLRTNVRLNGLANVKCEQVAVSDQCGTAVLYLSESDMSASLESDFEASTAAVQVPCSTLDDYLASGSCPEPLLIKVDVEGHEEAFFRGALHTLRTSKPDLITEVTHHEDSRVLSALREDGYRFYQITDQGLLPADELRLVVRGRLVFLNYLISARPEREVAQFFERIRNRVRKLDLYKSSKCVSPDLLKSMTAREQTLEVQRTGNPRPATMVAN